jgi:hypothetical protein
MGPRVGLDGVSESLVCKQNKSMTLVASNHELIPISVVIIIIIIVVTTANGQSLCRINFYSSTRVLIFFCGFSAYVV